MGAWLVWMDPFNSEPLAVEADAMTPALDAALQHEKTTVRRVDAADRRGACRQAFPDWKPAAGAPTLPAHYH